jgi:hypothetical protein
MSRMAGFDLVVEVSKQTALKLIQSNVAIGGTQLNPPFVLPVTVGPESLAWVMVTGMSLDLVGDQGINLVLTFENTSIISTTPAFTITLLDGSMTIGAMMQLVDSGNPDEKVLAADLAAATATVVFSAAAESRITAGLAGIGIGTAQLVSIAEAGMEDFVRSAGKKVIPAPAFTVKPGIIGSISMGRFERLLLRNIAGRSIGLFGMLLPDKPLGNAGDRTSSSIPAGQDLSVEIGADAFHRLIFCANLAGSGPVSALPPTCGGGSLARNGVTFTSFSDTFGHGHIDIDSSFQKSETCYEATGSVHARVTLSLAKIANQSVVSAHVTVDEPHIDVDVDWYCELAQALLGPLGLWLRAEMEASAKSAAKDLQSAVSSITGGGLVFGTGLAAARFNSVSIDPEAIVLCGTIAVDLPLPESPGLALAGSVTTARRWRIAEGEYVVTHACWGGTYPYYQEAQAQSGTFLVVPALLGTPLTLEWRLECWPGYFGFNGTKFVGPPILGGQSGEAVLADVTTAYPLPLPGGTSIVQPVRVSYDATNTRIRVGNIPADGNYGFMISVKATDPAGKVATASIGVRFEGDGVAILGDYHAKLAECIAGILERIKRRRLDEVGEVPPWVPVNYPRPDELIALMRFLAAAGTAETDQALLHTKLAHASSYLRALAHREAIEEEPAPDR